MFKAIALLFIPALLSMSLAASQSFAGDEKQQAAPATEPQKKQDMQDIKTRGFQKSAPAPAAAPAASPPPLPPRGDGGRPDDTIGGLPGHAPDMPARQP
jgi:hypothetical protein